MDKKTKQLASILVLFAVVFLLGMAMNMIAVYGNGGKMPVKFNRVYYSYQQNFETGEHFSYQDNNEVNFWYLSDIFKSSRRIFSIGDFFLTLGGIGGLLTVVSLNIHVWIGRSFDKELNKLLGKDQ